MANGTINQKRIANKLNISIGTVSRALRNSPDISPDTKTKVEKVARELGYIVGKSRANSQSRYVGVLIHSPAIDWHRNAYMDYLNGMSAACSQLNISIVVHQIDANNCEQILDPEYQPPAMRNGELCGLIMIFRWPPEIVRELSKRYKCVSLFHEVPNSDVSLVSICTRSGMNLLTQELVKNNHTRIGYLGFNGSISWARELVGAYYEAIAANNIQYDPQDVIYLPVEILNSDQPVLENSVINKVVAGIESGTKAWICAGDFIGYSLYKELTLRGYSVPEDVSLTGFNNTSAFTPEGFRELTSVTVPSREMGAEALRLLLDIAETPDMPERKVRFNCKLIKGDTVGKC